MVLENSVKQRIVRVLTKNPLPIKTIAEKSGICLTTASKYVHILEAEGKIKIRNFGNMKLVSKK